MLLMKEHVNELRKLINKWDMALIIILVLLSLFFIIYLKSQKKNDTVQIYLNNELYGEYDLNKDRIIKVGEHNIVEISKNKVRMKKSSCKNQQCVKMGWSSNLPIICVPNKIAVKMVVTKKQNKNEKMLISY
jgi:hypothetical protein